MPAEKVTVDSRFYAIYLMYRRWRNYKQCRVGMTKVGSLISRAISEGADALWVLDVKPNKNEAYYEEAWYSSKCGIPQVIWTGTEKTHEAIDIFWTRIGNNWDYGRDLIDFDHPTHWIRKGNPVEVYERRLAKRKGIEEHINIINSLGTN